MNEWINRTYDNMNHFFIFVLWYVYCLLEQFCNSENKLTRPNYVLRITWTKFEKFISKIGRDGAIWGSDKKCQYTALGRTNIKYSFTWLTGMKKVIFHFSNFFGFGHFLIHQIWTKGQKSAGAKKVIIIKNQFSHAR